MYFKLCLFIFKTMKDYSMSNNLIFNSTTNYRLRLYAGNSNPKIGDLVTLVENNKSPSKLIEEIYQFDREYFGSNGEKVYVCKKGSTNFHFTENSNVTPIKFLIVLNGVYDFTFFINPATRLLNTIYVDSVNMNSIILDSEKNPNKYFKIIKYSYNFSKESQKYIKNLILSNVLFDNYRILRADLNTFGIDDINQNIT